MSHLNSNISFAFQAIQKLYAHFTNLCFAMICKFLDDFGGFQRGPQENIPLGGLLFYKSQVVISCARTRHVSVGNTCHAAFATCTDGTTARAEHEGLGTNVWCSCTSTFCQTGSLLRSRFFGSSRNAFSLIAFVFSFFFSVPMGSPPCSGGTACVFR